MKWISVKDKLPEEDSIVLVHVLRLQDICNDHHLKDPSRCNIACYPFKNECSINDDVTMCGLIRAEFIDDDFYMFYEYGRYSLITYRVTHWVLFDDSLLSESTCDYPYISGESIKHP